MKGIVYIASFVTLLLTQCGIDPEPNFVGPYAGTETVQVYSAWKSDDGSYYRSDDEGFYEYDKVACNVAVQGSDITFVLRLTEIQLIYLFGERSFLDLENTIYLRGTREGDTIIFPEQNVTGGLTIYSGHATLKPYGGMDLKLNSSFDFSDFIFDSNGVTFINYTVFNYYELSFEKL